MLKRHPAAAAETGASETGASETEWMGTGTLNAQQFATFFRGSIAVVVVVVVVVVIDSENIFRSL